MTLVHIFWKGKGWQIALAAFACLVISEFVSDWITHDDHFYQNSPYPMSIAFVAAGAASLFITRNIKQKIWASNPNTTYDPFSNTLFFIPLEYWPWTFFGIAIVTFMASVS